MAGVVSRDLLSQLARIKVEAKGKSQLQRSDLHPCPWVADLELYKGERRGQGHLEKQSPN